MQGERTTVDSFPGMEQGSISNGTGMNQQTSWNNTINPVENRLSNYFLSSSETNFTRGSAVDHDVRGFSGWHRGEPSSGLSQQHQFIDDGRKMEQSWSSSFNVHAETSPRIDERQLEPSEVLYCENVNVGLHGSQVTDGHSFSSSSSSSQIPRNVDLNVGYVGLGANHGKGIQAGGHSGLYKLGGLETEQILSATDNVGSSSGSSGQFMEENDGESGSSANWGLSCKRKALEGTSRKSYPGGSSSCFPQADNGVWHTVPARYNASGNLNITTPPTNTPTGSPPDHLNPGFGVGIRSLASDPNPSSRPTGNAEIALRNLNRRATVGHQRESSLFGLPSVGSFRHSSAFSPRQTSRPPPVGDPLDLRSTAGVASNTTAPQSQSHVTHIPGLSRNTPPLPWNGSSNSRAGSSSNSPNLLGERGGTALREEANLRGIPRTSIEHPIFFPASETRNAAQDATSWGLNTGNVANPGVVPSTSQIGHGSGSRNLPAPGWIANRNPPARTQLRLSDFSPVSLFPSIDSESGSHCGPFPSFSSGSSASSQELMMSSGSNNQGHSQLFPRSAFMAERQGDDVFGSPHPFRTLAADIEGRHRLISEIRQVLSAMRRGEHLRAEDYMLFDPFIYHGMADLHDRHRDMRLDVDNMTYEELLALEERIGDVKTGLSEEAILKSMEQKKFANAFPRDAEPCCICQEKYAPGDELGTLACGHDFHTDCIKRWLMQKNLCPICKTTALVT